MEKTPAVPRAEIQKIPLFQGLLHDELTPLVIAARERVTIRNPHALARIIEGPAER
jgi:hypothetical protein